MNQTNQIQNLNIANLYLNQKIYLKIVQKDNIVN